MPPRQSESAPYHVQLRDAERRILAQALYAFQHDFRRAAESLGITTRYMQARVHQLGGILPDSQRNEPPPAIWAPRPKRTKETS